jgi:uncharacterized protein YfaP (DUF2135 family)
MGAGARYDAVIDMRIAAQFLPSGTIEERLMRRFFANKALLTLILVCLLTLLTSVTWAQTGQVLNPGEAVAGTFDDSSAAQIYTFTANAGESVTLVLDSQSSGLALTLILSDVQGVNLGQLRIEDNSAPVLSRLESGVLPQTGTYYVTIFPTAGVATLMTGAFTVTLEQAATGTPPEAVGDPAVAPAGFEPGFVSLLNGIEVNLRWNTRDDLNLQVRDPVGETLFWDSRTTTGGGTFGLDTNGLCETLSGPPAVETASWPGGAHATGSYEVLVYYRQNCEGSVPVEFTVDISVDGVALAPITGVLQPPAGDLSGVYVGSFSISADGSGVTGASGVYADTRALPIPAAELLAEPSTPILLDQPQSGVIDVRQPWHTYTFDGQAGDIVEISLSRTLGSLDTVMLILDSAGNIIAANDDTQFAANTDSFISNLRLPTNDTYTIVATRYGKSIGGTEGTYQLFVGGSSLPSELLSLELPAGDVEIMLTWNTNADLQLSVRDPFGSMVYDDVRRVQSGGVLAATGNINCTVSEGEPAYYIYWPEGFKRLGRYEINVWYQSECEDTRPVVFQLYVVVDGTLVTTQTSAIGWGERYLTSFNVGADSAEMGPGGIASGSDTLDLVSEAASAFRITSGAVVTGSIGTENPYDLYEFEGNVGDVLTVSLDQTSRTLDTQLFVMDPFGVEIASNDDANESTNSLISGLVLTQEGTYTIVATRFGTIYGGTEGGYELAFRLDSTG